MTQCNHFLPESFPSWFRGAGSEVSFGIWWIRISKVFLSVHNNPSLRQNCGLDLPTAASHWIGLEPVTCSRYTPWFHQIIGCHDIYTCDHQIFNLSTHVIPHSWPLALPGVCSVWLPSCFSPRRFCILSAPFPSAIHLQADATTLYGCFCSPSFLSTRLHPMDLNPGASPCRQDWTLHFFPNKFVNFWNKLDFWLMPGILFCP